MNIRKNRSQLNFPIEYIHQVRESSTHIMRQIDNVALLMNIEFL